MSGFRTGHEPSPVDLLARLFASAGGALYFGEAVTQLEHALQAAAFAELDGASDALVVAALLHDVGHLLHGHGEAIAEQGIDGVHEAVGAAWLAERAPAAVVEPVRLHVAAKRYLCATEPFYAAHLSDASRASLSLQGGPMSSEELLAFSRLPWAHDAVRLRRWDDAAKQPGRSVPAFEHYLPRLIRILENPVAPVRPSRAFDLVVLDVAGTTVLDGDAVVETLCAVLDPYARVSLDDAREVMGLPKPIALDRLLEAHGHIPDDARPSLVRELHRGFRAAMVHAYRTSPDIMPAPGVLRLFDALRKAGIVVALDTGFSRDILDSLLERLGWTSGIAIDFSLASDEVERGRPHPDLIRRAMARANVTDPTRVAKVGDTPADMEQGLAAGCGLVVGVTYGTHNRSQIQRDGVTVVDHLDELLTLFGVTA